jgi:DNA-binding transcriptional ArsR family regulator
LTYARRRNINLSVYQLDGSVDMPADHLSATFAALPDPTRRAILARLATGECSVTELAGPFEMSMPAVSKHLRVLERARLIARRREARCGTAESRRRRSRKLPPGPSAA